MKQLLRLSVVCVGIALMGFGCGTPKKIQTNTAPVIVPAPVAATFEGLSPSDAARKINLATANSIKIHQSFSSAGETMARQLGWGPEATYDVVIRRFAPGHHADIEWKRHTSVKTGIETASSTGIEQRQFDGAMTDGALQNGHSLTLPSTWIEGERAAFGSGILWVSSDVYENLVKSKMSTFTLGLFDQNAFTTVKGSAMFTDLMKKLTNESAKPEYKDTTLTQSDAPTVMSLNVNGKPVNVEVIVAHNWLADVVILNNPQNPLVLRVTMKQLPGISADGFFDYEVTDIQGITE